MKLEYTTCYLENEIHTYWNDILNEYGRMGWELVAVDNNTAFFKRPILVNRLTFTKSGKASETQAEAT